MHIMIIIVITTNNNNNNDNNREPASEMAGAAVCAEELRHGARACTATLRGRAAGSLDAQARRSDDAFAGSMAWMAASTQPMRVEGQPAAVATVAPRTPSGPQVLGTQAAITSARRPSSTSSRATRSARPPQNARQGGSTAAPVVPPPSLRAWRSISASWRTQSSAAARPRLRLPEDFSARRCSRAMSLPTRDVNMPSSHQPANTGWHIRGTAGRAGSCCSGGSGLPRGTGTSSLRVRPLAGRRGDSRMNLRGLAALK